jgi:hypothetical protein
MVIGASRNPDKFGNKAVRAYIRQGHMVFPVNPNEKQIEGLTCYANVTDVPGPIDRALVYLPPSAGLTVLEDLAGRDDVGELWLNPGSESEEIVAKAKSLGFHPIQACSIVDIGERP